MSAFRDKIRMFFLPLSHRTRKPDSLLLHWPQREGDCTSSSQGWCWHQHAREGHTLTYAPTHARACRQEGAHTPPFNTLPPSTKPHWHKPQILQCDKSQSSALRCAARTQYPPSPVRVLSVCTPLRNGRWQNLEKTSSSTPCIRWDAT